MAEANLYEEQRRRQVEENKRKLEELRLHRLSMVVRVAAVKPMPRVTLKPRNPRPWPDARSGGLAASPAWASSRITTLEGHIAVQGPHYSYLVPCMQPTKREPTPSLRPKSSRTSWTPFLRPLTLFYAAGSHLGIPPQFSKRYLPWCDEMILLVDEEGVEFHVLYRAHGSGLSATGWKQFAIAHKLAEADCLVFQQVERVKFKVYIVRASSYHEKDH
ncbi:hypothetical protein ACQ4PT_034285 [Festuca glaucescens]